ncbi:MAG TPA: hypothetical protein VMC43_02635, partial [Candidatus Paceibacterota bacterium]|nr:hypothetical protein [Candidatus Paceibacterota bacterium]
MPKGPELPKGYITLKEAAKISGYAPDYVGQLIRKGRLSGRQIYYNTAWITTEKSVREYLAGESSGKTGGTAIPEGFDERFRQIRNR